MNKKTKKQKISITLNKECYDYAKQQWNSSQYIENLIKLDIMMMFKAIDAYKEDLKQDLKKKIMEIL